MSILVVGSIAYDNIETPTKKLERVLGGSAVYFSYAASYFSKPRLVGVVGEDFEKEHIQLLKDREIDLEGLQIAKGKTFSYGCRYESDMNVRKTLFTDLNVFADFQPKIPKSYLDSQIVFLANIHPELQHEVLNQVSNSRYVAADSMNLWIDTAYNDLKRLLGRIDMLLINDEEAKQLTGKKHFRQAARELLRMGPTRIVIKRGEYGVAMFNLDGDIFLMPAFPVEESIDPTGAGDSFAGAFMGYLDKYSNFDETSMRKALLHGISLGGFAVEGFGLSSLSKLDLRKIIDRVQDLKAFTTV